MGTALLSKNVITEAQNILLKGIYELEGHLHFHLVDGTLVVDWIMNGAFPEFSSFTYEIIPSGSWNSMVSSSPPPLF